MVTDAEQAWLAGILEGWRLSRSDDIIGFLTLVLAHLGERRTEQANQAVAVARASTRSTDSPSTDRQARYRNK
jgi:hypothetical protein